MALKQLICVLGLGVMATLAAQAQPAPLLICLPGDAHCALRIAAAAARVDCKKGGLSNRASQAENDKNEQETQPGTGTGTVGQDCKAVSKAN